jgi:hypothetical protein
VSDQIKVSLCHFPTVMLNSGVALTLLASRLYVVYAEHAVGRNTQGAQPLIFVLGRPPELGHVCTATRRPPLSGAPLHLACASSHEVLRLSNCKAASRAELYAPKIGACVSPAPLSALSKYRPEVGTIYCMDRFDNTLNYDRK